MLQGWGGRPRRRRGCRRGGSEVFQFYGFEGDVGAVVHALEVDLLDRRVRARPRLDDGRPGPAHVEDPAPRGVELSVLLVGGSVVDVDARWDVLEARDLVSRVRRIRVYLRGEHDADGLVRRPDELAAGEVLLAGRDH